MRALLLGLVACGEGAVWLPLPRPEGAQSLVVELPAPAGPELFALDLADPRQALQADVTQEGRITVLAYESTLAEAGLSEGKLERSAQGRRLTGTDSVFGAAPLSILSRALKNEADWLPSELSGTLAEVRVQHQVRCPRFGQGHRSVVPGLLQYTVALDDAQALVRTRDGTIYLVDANGVRPATFPEARNFTAAFRDQSGQVWLGDDRGQIWKARTGVGGVTAVEPWGAPFAGPIYELAVGEGFFDTTEVFLVEGFEGNAWWVSGDDRELWGNILEWRSHLVHAGPGEAFLLAPQRGTVFHWINDRIAPESEFTPSLYGLDFVAGLGVVVGTEDGAFFRRVDDHWERLGERNYGWWGLAATRIEDGFLYLVSSGMVGSWSPRTGHCDDLGLVRIISVGDLALLGRNLVAVGRPADMDTLELIYLPRLD